MMDTKPLETNVYVHSPITEYSTEAGYYTTYAIHLMSNNPCFSSPHSHIRRRYSEFVRLRELLISHHPSLTPPSLPPKSYFNRFNDDFIELRMKGLQKFLTEALATAVYLSDKSLHLFLQSNSSMSEIIEQCLGDIPAPPLLDPQVFPSHSETSINTSARDPETQQFFKSIQQLVLDDCELGIQSQRTSTKTLENPIPSDVKPSRVPSLKRSANKPILIPKRFRSLNSSAGSSPSSSPSNFDTHCSFCSERFKDRRVSFNERVKIAVVTRYGISVLRP